MASNNVSDKIYTIEQTAIETCEIGGQNFAKNGPKVEVLTEKLTGLTNARDAFKLQKKAHNSKKAFPLKTNILTVTLAIIAIGLVALGVTNLYLWSSLPLTICSFGGAGLIITADIGLLAKGCHQYYHRKDS